MLCVFWAMNVQEMNTQSWMERRLFQGDFLMSNFHKWWNLPDSEHLWDISLLPKRQAFTFIARADLSNLDITKCPHCRQAGLWQNGAGGQRLLLSKPTCLLAALVFFPYSFVFLTHRWNAVKAKHQNDLSMLQLLPNHRAGATASGGREAIGDTSLEKTSGWNCASRVKDKRV